MPPVLNYIVFLIFGVLSLISVSFPIIGFIIIFPYYRCRFANSSHSSMIISISLTYKAVNYKQLCLTLNVFLGHIFIRKHFLHGLLFYKTEIQTIICRATIYYFTYAFNIQYNYNLPEPSILGRI
jgi:hypothetical protein